jgi:hypothetical protein
MSISGKKVKENITSRENTDDFEKKVVEDYLRYGSVDEIFRANHFNLPVSYPGVYHILNRWGVVRATGRANTPLSENIGFLVRMVEERIPLEALYRQMPPSFTSSMSILHRIYSRAKKEVKKQVEKRDMRRVGTALILTPDDNPHVFLIGRDVSPPSLDVGKPYGAISFPMGFSKKGERAKAITRILQQEVFTQMLLENREKFHSLSEKLTQDTYPFMFLDIADIRVSVYHIELPRKFSETQRFSSFKIKNYRYVSVEDVIEASKERNLLREGIFEITTGYADYKKRTQSAGARSSLEPFYKTAFLNQKIKLLAQEQALREA